MTDIHKDDVAGVFRFWKIVFCDSIAEGGGCGVVDQPQDIKTCNGSSVQHGSSLDIGVPDGNSEHDVLNANFEFVGSDISQLAEIHPSELGSRERLRLAHIVDLDTDCSAGVNQGSVHEGLFDILDFRVVNGSTDQSFKRSNGVSEVGSFLSLCRLSDCTLSWSERYERSIESGSAELRWIRIR